MSGAHSISTRRAYGVQRICRVWERASCALGFSWTLDCERVLAGGVSR